MHSFGKMVYYGYDNGVTFRWGKTSNEVHVDVRPGMARKGQTVQRLVVRLAAGTDGAGGNKGAGVSGDGGPLFNKGCG